MEKSVIIIRHDQTLHHQHAETYQILLSLGVTTCASDRRLEAVILLNKASGEVDDSND